MYVYQLVARYVCPFTGFESRPDETKQSTTLFTSTEAAHRREDAFKAKIRSILKVGDDYPIEVTLKQFEVIED